MSRRSILNVCLAASCLLSAVALSKRAAAQPRAGAQGAPARDPKSVEEAIARLQQEVRDLRQMLIQAMQVEQQHYDLLLKLIQSQLAGRAPGEGLPMPGSPRADEGTAVAAGTDRPQPVARTGTVTGTVKVTGAPAGQPVFAFIEDLRGPSGRGNTIEIVQQGKQFSPQVSVVPVGTRASFPNQDVVFHNAFSLSRGNPFDLSLKAGERGSPVLLGRPGLVEVYCDIHAKMWAEILVIRSNHIARVGADGTFSLPDVPVGQRVVAAWTAGTPPVKRTVQLTGSGARAELALKVPWPRPAHNNKLGEPYGHYAE